MTKNDYPGSDLSILKSAYKSRTTESFIEKKTSTEQLWQLLFWALRCIKIFSFLLRILAALYPKTKSNESITFDFPLPFGPMMEVNPDVKQPSLTLPENDLKFSHSIQSIVMVWLRDLRAKPISSIPSTEIWSNSEKHILLVKN